MREYYKEKVKTYTELRSNLFTCIIVLTGGIVGLFFTQAQPSLVLAFAFIGGYFDFIFLQNMISVHKEICLTLEELKNECS